jgi:hypothetical protein
MNKGNASAAAFASTDIYITLAHKFAPEPKGCGALVPLLTFYT